MVKYPEVIKRDGVKKELFSKLLKILKKIIRKVKHNWCYYLE